MRGHFTTLQVLLILLAVFNGLWALMATGWFWLFYAAGVANPRFPGLSPQGYNLYLCWYGAWMLFSWLSCILNFVSGIAVSGGRWRGLVLTTSLLNLVPGISFLWFAGIPVGGYGLFVTLHKRAGVVFRRVARGAMLVDALEDEQLARADARRAGRRRPDDEEPPPRRNEPPRESW